MLKQLNMTKYGRNMQICNCIYLLALVIFIDQIEFNNYQKIDENIFMQQNITII